MSKTITMHFGFTKKVQSKPKNRVLQSLSTKKGWFNA